MDNVAASILLEEAPSGYLPVMVKGDGNCLFGHQALSHLEKRSNIIFYENAEYYADQFLSVCVHCII